MALNNRDHRDFRTRPVKRSQTSSASCAPWAALLPDAAEGLLTDAEQRALDQHLALCPECSEELAAAQRGLAWLTVLKDQTPEPPAHLLANILAQTTGMAEAGVMLPELPLQPVYTPLAPALEEDPRAGWQRAGASVWSWVRGDAGTWSTLLQPRLAMTGAMAFFSICLTLNLLGISVNQLDAQTFRKGGLHRTVANTSATIVRSIHGLRVVYQVESRVNEMRAQMDGPDAGSPGR